MTGESHRVTGGPEIRPREYGCAVLRAEGKGLLTTPRPHILGAGLAVERGRGPVLLGLYRASKCPHRWPCSAWVVRQ